MILEFNRKNGGRRWDESEVGLAGLGMREAILDAGTDLVVPSSKRMTYCGDVVGSMGMSMTVPDWRIALLLELG
jgi:hypothetical protein